LVYDEVSIWRNSHQASHLGDTAYPGDGEQWHGKKLMDQRFFLIENPSVWATLAREPLTGLTTNANARTAADR
jgi:hypothetical protein